MVCPVHTPTIRASLLLYTDIIVGLCHQGHRERTHSSRWLPSCLCEMPCHGFHSTHCKSGPFSRRKQFCPSMPLVPSTPSSDPSRTRSCAWKSRSVIAESGPVPGPCSAAAPAALRHSFLPAAWIFVYICSNQTAAAVAVIIGGAAVAVI